MSVWIRPAVQAAAAYVPGARPERASGARISRLASNELPFPPTHDLSEAASDAIANLNRYPDMGNAALVSVIAERARCSEEQVAVGAGSTTIIRDLLFACSGPDNHVLTAATTFPYYSVAATLAGAPVTQVPLADGVFDLNALSAAVTDHTSVIVLCNPNNPTGTMLDIDDIRKFSSKVPATVLIVIDEAYIEFSGEGTTALALRDEFDNILVLRTLSKAHGLAGLRIGYAIGPASVASAIRKVTPPFSIGSISQALAAHAVSAGPEGTFAERVARVLRSRERLESELERLAVPFYPSSANFVFLPLGDLTGSFVDACLRSDVLVRRFPGGARVTVGDDEDTARVIDIVRSWAAAR